MKKSPEKPRWPWPRASGDELLISITYYVVCLDSLRAYQILGGLYYSASKIPAFLPSNLVSRQVLIILDGLKLTMTKNSTSKLKRQKHGAVILGNFMV
jgi:hypothetical protein